MLKPPPSFPPTTIHPLDVSLILGSFVNEPKTVPLFFLAAPPSSKVPAHPDEIHYYPQPEIFHTFRPDQTHPPKIISLVFAILALSPWVVLLGLVRSLHSPFPMELAH